MDFALYKMNYYFYYYYGRVGVDAGWCDGSVGVDAGWCKLNGHIDLEHFKVVLGHSVHLSESLPLNFLQ